ncbi:hypothetical protein L484_007894 [Morus notabilis]|uniref:Uncharacterized protein n=1 Tax=Morus notabilis TaxID=981085 RepID=W9SFZ4_9ROSA|nr:hypothetical protein L484_007894 [Morus notabilis]
MASLQSSFSSISAIRSCCSSSSSSLTPTTTSLTMLPETDRRSPGVGQRLACRAMVQQTVQGAPAAYAKEMERLSAKESLLLAFKDAGGFEALVSGKTTDMHMIDVNERITGLERLNPTPRPTTRFPPNLANLSKMDVVIKDAYANITANTRLLNSIECRFILSTKLSVEGPLRMKEEYVEGVLETPKVIEETVPDQLKGALGQAASTIQQLPIPVRDAFSSGLKFPLRRAAGGVLGGFEEDSEVGEEHGDGDREVGRTPETAGCVHTGTIGFGQGASFGPNDDTGRTERTGWRTIRSPRTPGRDRPWRCELRRMADAAGGGAGVRWGGSRRVDFPSGEVLRPQPQL